MIAASDVPLWATLLIGLAGGILGVLATTRHERGAEYRTRMLDAADEYIGALTVASGHATELKNMLVSRERVPEEEVDAAFRRLEVARDEVLTTLARIDLLFGPATRTWASASTAAQAIEDAVGSLRGLRAGDARAETRLAFNGSEFGAAVDGFGAAVRADIRGSGVGFRVPPWITSLRGADRRNRRSLRVPSRLRNLRGAVRALLTRFNRWLHRLRYRLAR